MHLYTYYFYYNNKSILLDQWARDIYFKVFQNRDRVIVCGKRERDRSLERERESEIDRGKERERARLLVRKRKLERHLER